MPGPSSPGTQRGWCEILTKGTEGHKSSRTRWTLCVALVAAIFLASCGSDESPGTAPASSRSPKASQAADGPGPKDQSDPDTPDPTGKETSAGPPRAAGDARSESATSPGTGPKPRASRDDTRKQQKSSAEKANQAGSGLATSPPNKRTGADRSASERGSAQSQPNGPGDPPAGSAAAEAAAAD